MSGEVEVEPWWNVVLLRVSWLSLALVCGTVIYFTARTPSAGLNLLKLHSDVPKPVLQFCGMWVATRLGMSIWHYSACNDGHVPYCYSFLEDMFTSLYVCLVLMCGYVNTANSLLVVALGLYTALPSPITCWWLLVVSVLVAAYQTWAMWGLAADRPQKVGLLHINYALVVHWMLYFFAYPATSGYSWGDEISLLRDWQIVIHVLVAGGVAFLLVRYTHKEPVSALKKEEVPMREPPV